MAIVIDSTISLQLTDDKVVAFIEWAKIRYSCYTLYKIASTRQTDDALDEYIKTNLLPQYMKTLLRFSEPYVGVRTNDANIKELRMNRQRVLNKVRYMKNKLGKITFKEEIDEWRRHERERRRHEREQSREMAARQILMRELEEGLVREIEQEYRERVQGIIPENNERIFAIVNRMIDVTTDNLEQNREQFVSETLEVYRQHYFQLMMDKEHRVIVIYKKKEIKEEESMRAVECCICMEEHNICCTIEGPCGHKLGKSCFEEWVKKSKNNVCCPLCRGNCNEVSELVFSM